MSQRFDFTPVRLNGLFRIDRHPIPDTRGAFSRFFCAEEFKEAGLTQPIAQMNHTLTIKKGTIRGMHFQYPPHSETKIVTCLHGKVFDVAVDIRKDSPTYLQWHAEILSAENQRSLYIPSRFAHGFQTLTENCQMLYIHSQYYVPKAQGALNPRDPKLAVQWPITVTEISDKDQNHPMIDERFKGLDIG